MKPLRMSSAVWRKTGSPSEKERAEIQSFKAEIARLKSGLERGKNADEGRKDKMIRKANEEAQQIPREAKTTRPHH